MKEISISSRWQMLLTTYEDIRQAIRADTSLNPEEKLKRVAELQEKIVDGLDVLEEKISQ